MKLVLKGLQVLNVFAMCKNVEAMQRPGALTKTLRVMQLTAIFLFVLCIQVSARTSGQTISFSGENIPLQQVFNVIKKQTGYVVLWDVNLQANAKPVTVIAKNIPLEDFLTTVLKGQNLTYSIISTTISIKRDSANKLSAKDLFHLYPPIKISGTVKGASKQPLVGATVLVKNKGISTVTDERGYFEITADPGNLIVISYIGFESKEFKVETEKPFTIELQRLDSRLDTAEVIINTGYQQIAKERATGSFAQPNTVLYNNRTTTDIISKLEGITSGLVFNRAPNGTPRLQIRGQSTINADPNPLIVVDNFPYDGDINNINPNDVESVTVLKDAAAASIWGARAGNGVIVITTKKAKYNQLTQIDASAFFSLSSKPDLTYNRNFLNSNDFIDLETDLFNKGFYNNDLTSIDHPPVSPVVEILYKQRNGLLTPEQAGSQINNYRDIDVRDQLQDYFYQREKNQQYALTMSGGNAFSSYRMSVGFDRNEASLVNDYQNRVTTNIFSRFRPVNKLELYGGINYIQADIKSNSIVGDLRTGGSPNLKGLMPYARFADEQGNPLPMLRNHRDSFINVAPQMGLLNWQYYPLVEKELADNKSLRTDIRLTTGVKYNIISGLSIEGDFQYQKGKTDNTVYYDANSFYTRNLVNRFSTVSGGMLTARNIPLGSILENRGNGFVSKNLRGQLNFSKVFNDHSINAILGSEWRDMQGEIQNQHTLYGYNRSNDSYGRVNYTQNYSLFPSGSGTIRNIFDIEHSVRRFRSYFTNVSYDYKDLYTVSLSGRIDQANLFGVKTNDRQVPLWSAGFKWNISNEKFYSVAWLKQLQLRTTYGFSGNMLNNGSAYTIALYSAAFSSLFPAQYSIQSPGNPELRWEKTGMLNLGVDFQLTNNIISGSIEYYTKKGRDLVGTVPLPSSTGFANATVNYGQMKGRGVDVNLNANIINNHAFEWSAGILFSYAADKITRYSASVISSYLEGRPVNALYAYKWAGLDPVDGNPRGYDTAGKISTEYNVLVLANAMQKAYAGRLNPSIFGGLRNSLSYKGVTLTANISYKFDYYFVRSAINYSNLYYSWGGHMDYKNRWQKPGDEQFTDVPSASSLPVNLSRDAFYAGSEALITKGDHIRLQDIILSYAFTNSSVKVPFKQIQFSLNASNVAIVWRANNFKIDPDFPLGDYAPPKMFAASVKATF